MGSKFTIEKPITHIYDDGWYITEDDKKSNVILKSCPDLCESAYRDFITRDLGSNIVKLASIKFASENVPLMDPVINKVYLSDTGIVIYTDIYIWVCWKCMITSNDKYQMGITFNYWGKKLSKERAKIKFRYIETGAIVTVDGAKKHLYLLVL
jgi:hypothetical protein